MPVAAPTLPIPATVNIAQGNTLSEKARLRKAPFGDGYLQRSRDGRNHIAGSFPVSFENLTRAEGETLMAFFRERGGDLPFYFTPPGEARARLWTCEEWSRTYVGAIHVSVAGTLIEQFDP